MRIENRKHGHIYDVVLVICGCSCACANVKDLKARKILVITSEDVIKAGVASRLLDNLLHE